MSAPRIGLLGRVRAMPVFAVSPSTEPYRVARIVLIVIGVAIGVVGGVILLNDVAPKRFVGLATWLIVAVVLHDAVLAPVLVAAGLAFLRVRERLRIGRLAATIVQGALVVAGVLTAIGVPGLLANRRGSANMTIATTPYLLSVAVVWVAAAVVIAAALVLPRAIERRARRK
ncbi:hypothetical protein GCM10027515_30960 [Schumannella luteola]|uniref:Cytochrome bd-type quinol oxidase subunit 2 n=1 Tax=Schumannella luteola TaxID=472059 RepID=A0A852YB86_9MICO|nr:hypothetical protein [Schumannella luteola]NYG99102.1 cytochrome bd-type quinol oxidase subunit 2 [Schumannella luteola]TPX06450.1 hypothetical protein FJ656_02130 [Schumannella luteola]